MKLEKKIKIGGKEISLKNIILGLGGTALILIILFFVLSGFNKVKPLYDENDKPIYIEESNLNNIYTDATNYKGKFIDLGGKVFNIQNGEDYTAVQIYADVDNSEKNTIIYINENTDIKQDDYIKITGYIVGTTEYSNTLGGQVSAPAIMATKVEKSNYMDVARPTIKEVKFTDKIIDQHGYKIEVNKIEFAEQETRVYITATNNASDNFSIYLYSTVITQNGKQFDMSSNYNYDDELELNNDLKPGIKTSGFITFKNIDQTDFNLIMDGSSDNWDIDLNEYNFNLEIN